MNTSTTMGDVISSDKVEGTNVYNVAGDKLGSVDEFLGMGPIARWCELRR